MMKMTMRLRIRTTLRAHKTMVQSTTVRGCFLVAVLAAVLLLLVAPLSRTVVSAQSTEASSSPSITGRNPSTANFADISYKQICPTTTTTSESSWQTGSQLQGEAESLQPVVVLINDNTTKTIAFVVMPNASGQDEDEEEDGDGEEEEEEGKEENRGGDRVLKTRTRRRIQGSRKMKRWRGIEDTTLFADARADATPGNNSLEFEHGFSVGSSTIDFILPNETNRITTISRSNNKERRYLEEHKHAQRQEQEQEQEQPTNNQPQQQIFIHFDNLTSTQQSEIFYVRKCFCPRPAGTDEVVQHFCNLQSSYCAVYDLPPERDGDGDGDVTAGNTNTTSTSIRGQGVHCYTVDMQLVVSRNAWPLVLLWYLALVLACCCTIHGFLACEYLRRVCVVGHSKYEDEFLQRMNISSSRSGGTSTESEPESGGGGGGDHDDEGNGDGGGGENSRGDRPQQQARPPQVQEGPESPAFVLANQQSISGGEGGFFQYAQALGGNFFGTARQQRQLMFEYNLWLQANWITRHEMREEQRQDELERVEQMLMFSGSAHDGDGDGDGGIELQEQRYERPHPRLELKVSRWKAVVAKSSVSTTTSTFNSNVTGDNEDVVQVEDVEEDTKLSSSTTTTGGTHEEENDTTDTDHDRTATDDVGETTDATTSETCCTICLLDLEDGDRVGDLSCGHVFHVDCLKQWSKRKNSCPLCAQPLGIVKTYDRPSTTFSTGSLTMHSTPGTANTSNATMDTNNSSTTVPPVGPNVDEIINRRVQRSLRHQQRRIGQNSSSRRSSSSSINRGGGMARSSNRSMELRIRRAHELALDGQGHSLDPEALRRFGRPYSELNSMQLRVMRNERQQEERMQQQQLRRRESSNFI